MGYDPSHRRLLVVIKILIIICASPYTNALSLNISSFDINRSKDLVFDGDATISGSALQLTKNQMNGPATKSGGRALYRKSMQLWEASKGNTSTLANFTTQFSFNISDIPTTSLFGDGITFLLLPENSSWHPNSYGGLLGLFDSDVSALGGPTTQVVAIEFDTYLDPSWDQSSDHIGIDVNSIRSQSYVNVTDGFMNKGTANALVAYNSATKNLSASLTFLGSLDSYHVSYIVDLSVVLPQRVQVGFTASTGISSVEIHEVFSWSFDSSLDENTTQSQGLHKGVMLIVYLAMGVVGLLAAVCLIILGMCVFIARRKLASKKSDKIHFELDEILPEGAGPKEFSYSEIERATNNFGEESKLGEGGFGAVYRGKLTNPEIEIAVKKMKQGAKQGKKEFIAEISIISSLRHKNLVKLVGWCHDRKGLLLVYEYMSNGSLDAHLFSDNLPPLSWPARYNIAKGLAYALQYLQHGWEQCVVHRDIKSSNIMLDSHLNARLGDFGLARFTDHGKSMKSTAPAGTLPYIAPEVFNTGRANRESDIYSFGVVALEIACGRRPIILESTAEGPRKLVDWVWDFYGEKDIVKAVDKSIVLDEDQAERLLVVGLWCCYPEASERPIISQVIDVLDKNAPLPKLPEKSPVPIFVPPSYRSSILKTTAHSSDAAPPKPPIPPRGIKGKSPLNKTSPGGPSGLPSYFPGSPSPYYSPVKRFRDG